MPFATIADLPPAVKTAYSPACQAVFLKAFNRAVSDTGIGGALSEEKAMKIAHAAAGMCKGAGKSEPVSKAAPLEPDDMDAWFAGKIPRRLLAIPFSGPIVHPRSAKGIDMDGEFFDERTDIKPDWFSERPVDWHHSLDPSGKLNGALIAKARNLTMDEDGWWVDLWLNAGEQRLGLIRKLAEKGAELYGSSYAYPNLIKRNAKTGHIDVWPYMMQTLSTSPQNTNSIHRPAKAVLDLYDQADIAVLPVLADVLTELANLRELPSNFPMGGDTAAKAGRELSGANLSEIDAWLEMLDSITKRAKELRSRVTSKYTKPEDVSSNS